MQDCAVEFIVEVYIKLIDECLSQQIGIAVREVRSLKNEMMHILVMRFLELADSSSILSHMNHLISYV